MNLETRLAALLLLAVALCVAVGLAALGGAACVYLPDLAPALLAAAGITGGVALFFWAYILRRRGP